jgi:DNA topoisomerase III
MKLFIAEKPDLAKDIVKGLDEKFEQKDGFYQSSNYYVTWCFGHVLEMVDPEQINPDYAKWKIEDLPLKLYPVKLKPKKSASKQVKIILDLIKKSDEIVNAGDPDDEGQLLVDEILIYCNNKKPVERLLINDNTDKAVREALGNMKSNNLYKGLYLKALARSVSDAIYGLSMTRAVTIQAQKNGNKGVLSIGRVQTPILALIVKRYLENKNHQKSFYFVINGIFNSLKGSWKATENAPLDDKKRLISKDYAQSVANKVKNKTGYIISKTLDDKEVSPPLPYNLVKLQQDMNKLFGYTASQTLEITQELREKFKSITYNRSDCSYLSDEQYQKSPALISKLKCIDNYHSINFNCNIKSKAFDSSKITAHTAIIPSDNVPDIDKLSLAQKNVYFAIVERFLCQFLPSKKYQSLTINVSIENESFILKANKTIDVGFTSFLKEDNNEIDDITFFDELNKLDINDSVICNDAIVEEKETKPQPLFTEASLLSALVRVADFVEDPKIKLLLKNKDKDKKYERGGIGTPATRHTMIETLKNRGFIKLDKKNLIPTELGLSFCQSLPQKVLLPDLTALLSEQQELIQSGELSLDEFVNNLYDDITKLISTELDISIVPVENKLSLNCPACSCTLLSKDKLVHCKNCDFKIWKTIAGKTLTENQINMLIEKKVTNEIKGFTSKAGKLFNAKLELVDNTVKFKFK